MTVPTKIRAVAEDPENPLLDCYADDPTALAKFFATGTITPTAPPTKKDTTTMSLYPETVTAAKPSKRPMPGIGASNDPRRLVDVLARLGLCRNEMATPLKELAATGQPLGKFFQVSVWDLDRALADVECTVSQRMQLKASLDHAGLLTVPKV